MSSELQQRMGEYLARREARYVDLLRHMVHVNSFTTNREGIAALGDLTAVSFEGLGFAAESVAAENPDFGDHLFLTRRSASGGAAPAILLVSHLDTVFSREEERRNEFVWREEGDRLHGPGTVDAKGGTVVAYMMLDALRERAPEVFDALDWVVALNAAEERSAEDFGPLCLARAEPGRTSACLVFEGGAIDEAACRLVVARKGMAVFDISVEGRGAHAGSRHPYGANAVVQLAHVIGQIAEWTDYARDLTVNVGSVRGGSLVNRVPHAASGCLEVRAFDPEVFAEALGRVVDLAEMSTVASPEDGFRCTVRVEKVAETPPWPPNDRTRRLFELWSRAAALMGREAHREQRGGLSDANHLWAALPTLDALGPDGGNGHCSERSSDGRKDQEYAARSSLVPKALLSALGVVALLGSDDSGEPATD